MHDSTISNDNRLVAIQRNPRSGSGAGREELLVLVRELRRAGFAVRMFRSRPALDSWLALPEKRRRLRCIVAAGGDGTVADIVNRFPGCPVAVLPLGTENLLAQYLEIPRSGRELAKMVIAGRTRTLDSAMVNHQRFLLMLSAGIDGNIVHAIHANRTGTIRRIGYLWPTLRAFWSLSPASICANTPDGKHSATGTHVIVTNIPRYGFGLKFAPEANPDDGLLNVRVYHGKSRLQVFWHAVRLKLGLPIHAGEFTKFTATEVLLESCGDSRGAGVQADGDPCMRLPVHVAVQPASLHLLVR